MMDENRSILELQVDQPASKNLTDAARWAKFLSIVGFVFIGLLIIFFLAMQSAITSALAEYVPAFSASYSFGILLGVVVVAVGIICVLMIFLFRASTLIRKGIETKNQETFNNGLASLKAYFTMYGILTIISLLGSLINFNR
jgi:uncharacterized membrane protein YdbT with pleckstrin-like domain